MEMATSPICGRTDEKEGWIVPAAMGGQALRRGGHFQRTTRGDLEVIGCCRIWNCTISFASQEVSWAFERPVVGVKQMTVGMTSMHLMLRRSIRQLTCRSSESTRVPQVNRA